MRVIFCDSVFDNKLIEPEYEKEKLSVVKNGFSTSLISHEELTDGNVAQSIKLVRASETKELGIYRGWMLTPSQYEDLYNGLLNKNIELINSPTEYTNCHYLPESYGVIEQHTPKSNWTEQINDSTILELASQFDNNPIIIKDFVKSEKHNWEDACYIPKASDQEHVKSVVKRFLELRGTSLNKGIVFRQFEELEFLTDHSISGMPLTKEFRVFFYQNKLASIFDYWDEGNYDGEKPNLEIFEELATKINSNFFTMDIAKKKNGEWIIMELGDGQVSGLPDNANTDEFFSSLK